MAFTTEFLTTRSIGDLYQLSIEGAAQLVHDGLWDNTQATANEIEEAIVLAISRGDLKTVRGSLNSIGRYTANPPILDAFDVAKWAEHNGLELESNGAFSGFLEDESELYGALEEKLKGLRAIQKANQGKIDIEQHLDEDAEVNREKMISLIVENAQLRDRLAELTTVSGLLTPSFP